jgi:guanylate kinase
MDHAQRTRRGLLIVLSSPSGAGKSTIGRKLMEEDPTITMSISATTRPMRPGEVADVDYHFVDEAQFQELVDTDELAEWAYVFGYRYGSPKEPIKEALRLGRDTLFDIDWQGTQQLEYAFRTDLVRIFILPPTMEELRRRLEDRGTDEADVIDYRMKRSWRPSGCGASASRTCSISSAISSRSPTRRAIPAAGRRRGNRPRARQAPSRPRRHCPTGRAASARRG